MKKILLATAFICICIFSLNAEDRIKYGPWITNMTDSTMTVLWTTHNATLGWVETEGGSRTFDTFAGRRTFGYFHSVRIKGLAAGTEIKYRIGGQNLIDDSNARYPKFDDEWCGLWESVRTFDSGSDSCHFCVMNDIHMDTIAYKALAAQIDIDKTDFLFLNGDIISTGNYGVEDYLKYEISPLGDLAQSLPIQFARGNHEGRGNGIRNVLDIYPNNATHAFYYTFRQGPVAFIVFDGGETGKDRSILYSGSEVYCEYIDEQITWARKAMETPEFKSAPAKVCILHVPMIDHPNKDDFHLQRYLNNMVLPILNEASIDLMIGADLHTFMLCEKGSMSNDFPILVNANKERLDCIWRDGHFSINIYSPEGTLLHSLNVRPTE